MKKLLLSCLLFMVIPFTLHAQVYSNKEVGKKNAEAIDSLKNSEYPYSLPIWGAKATKAGFNLPYSAGLSVQYIWQKSDLVIDNLQVGFNNGPLYNLDEIVRFKNARSEAQGVNFRPDVWLFPFLNVYGILAKSSPSTTIDAGVYVPDADGNWSEVVALNTKADFQATSFGFGFTPTIGVAGGFMALDVNFTWNDIAELDKPAFAFIFGPRFGKTFKLKKPGSAIAVWVGGFRLKLNSGTTGSLNFDDLFDTDGLQTKVDNGLQAVDDKQVAVDSWWNGLSAIDQNKPGNIAKYETANRALERAGTFLNSMDEAMNDEQSASVQYSLDKRPKDMWNFVVGTQYQFNKHWMLRAEVGMLGSRQQFIGGLQYRFGL
jgi:hypothetical protein